MSKLLGFYGKYCKFHFLDTLKIFFHSKITRFCNRVMPPKMYTEMQTVKTLIRMLVEEEQSDLGLLCFPSHSCPKTYENYDIYSQTMDMSSQP